MSASSGARRWWALGALSLVVLAVALPVTILSVALPTLAPALHASAADLQWFVSAYTLVLAAGVLPGGLLGDRFGRKKILLAALMIYGGGSVLAATSTTPAMFIAAQAVLGLGAAFVIPLVLSGITVLFTAEERPRAVGIWAAANFLALPLGPIVGGWLLSNHWWGWVFLMNLPIIALALVAVLVLLPESRSAETPALDPLGVLASSVGLGVLTFGMVRAGQDGWSSAGALTGMLGGLAILVGFALWERGLDRRSPGRTLVDLSLFHSARFTWGTILAGLGIFAFFGLLFVSPQYFQAVLGTDAMGSGVRLLPLLGGMMVGAGAADRVADRVGAKITVTAGFVVLGGALVLATATTATSGYELAATWIALGGLGAGLALATASSAALAAMSVERAGGRVRADAGGAEARYAAGRGDPGQRAQRGLPGPAEPHGPAGRGHRGGAGQRVRRRRGRRPARLGRTARRRPQRVRARPRPDALGGRRGRGGRRRADAAVPAGARHPGRER